VPLPHHEGNENQTRVCAPPLRVDMCEGKIRGGISCSSASGACCRPPTSLPLSAAVVYPPVAHENLTSTINSRTPLPFTSTPATGSLV
jgi:hypothetical protein